MSKRNPKFKNRNWGIWCPLGKHTWITIGFPLRINSPCKECLQRLDLKIQYADLEDEFLKKYN